MPISVAIVENERSVRDELATLLDESENFYCVGKYSTGEQALKLIPNRPRPDVVLMDINLGEMSGVACTFLLKQAVDSLQIVMLTICDDQRKIFDSLKAGASGYLLKRTPTSEILEAIEEVHGGGAPMSSYIARQVVQSFSSSPTVRPVVALSSREKEVLALVAKGYINKEIANLLGLTVETINGYLKHIYLKLRVRSRTEAAMKYFKTGD